MKRVLSIIISGGLLFSLAWGDVIPRGKRVHLIDNMFLSVGAEKGYEVKTPPEACSTYTVEDGIDYGDDFNCAILYSNARHIAQVLGVWDVPMVAWETGVSFDRHVRSTYWDDFVESWTPPDNIDDCPYDAGRVALAADANGNIHAVWHQSDVEEPLKPYEIFYSKWSGSTWSTPVQVSTDALMDVYPSIIVDISGNPWVVWKHGDDEDVLANHSTNGGDTWAGVENVTNTTGGMPGGWQLPAIDAAPNGDIHVTLNYDISEDGWMDIVHIERTGATWQPPETVALATPDFHPLCFPSIVVDTANVCHIVYQENTSDSGGINGSLSGFKGNGPSGQLYYTNNKNGIWSTPVGIPQKYPGGAAGVGASGAPNIGIDATNTIYISFTEPPFAYEENDTTVVTYHASNAYYVVGTLDANYDATFTRREMVSSYQCFLPIEDTRNAMYAQITQKVPESGPGIIWGSLVNLAQPSAVCYHHMEGGLPPDCDIEATSIVSPSGDALGYGDTTFLILESTVLDPGLNGKKSYDIYCLVTKDAALTDTVAYSYQPAIQVDSGTTSQDTFGVDYLIPQLADTYYFQFWVSGVSDLDPSNDTLYKTCYVGVEENPTDVPTVFSLSESYPNPVRGNASIKYTVPATAQLNIKVYDITGKFVATLVDRSHKPGTYTTNWNRKDSRGDEVSGGIYFYRLTSDKFKESATRKIVVLR